MLSQTAEYALRAMVFLATTHPQPATNRTIAEACQVPADYLAKILNSLKQQGLLSSQRGRSGGFVLTSPPSDITMLDVVDAVDPIERVLECPRKLESHCDELCPLHRFLDREAVRMRASLQTQTIAELADGEPHTFPQLTV